ncbi:unnamed protein product, partial [Meganyctiphanes norvegica]
SVSSAMADSISEKSVDLENFLDSLSPESNSGHIGPIMSEPPEIDVQSPEYSLHVTDQLLTEGVDTLNPVPVTTESLGTEPAEDSTKSYAEPAISSEPIVATESSGKPCLERSHGPPGLHRSRNGADRHGPDTDHSRSRPRGWRDRGTESPEEDSGNSRRPRWWERKENRSELASAHSEDPLTREKRRRDRLGSFLYMGFVLGSISAAVRTLWDAPFSRVKILLQTQSISTQLLTTQRYKGMVDCFLRVPKEQGFLSLWRGNLGSIAASVPTVGSAFALNNFYKGILLQDLNKNTQYWRHFAESIAAGGAAGATSLLAVYPFHFSRTRLGADVGRTVADRQFAGHINCYKNIFKSDGIRGLYRGFGTSVTGIVVYRASYFGLYDFAKYQSGITKNIPSIGLGMGVATAAGIIAYPLDTVRVRLMMQSGRTAEQVLYKNTLDCFRKMIAKEGVRSLYNGLLPRLLQAPVGGFMLFAWDKANVYYY